MLSIIIPVLDEANIINETIKHIINTFTHNEYEIIIVDGGSNANTLNKISIKGVTTLRSEASRAIQMNQGAQNAKGEILLFLHADTMLPKMASNKISQTISDGCVAGAFNLGFDVSHPWLNLIAFITSIRSRITRIPYGDQAIFVAKDFFKKIGGYKKIPLMEDVELMKSIKRSGGRIKILKESVVTSSRRWTAKGMLKTTALNNLIRTLYLFGVSAEKLKKIYY
ncbi:MAG: TIGR04283 family arsenosugar biosynthesis glycosyltransferase [bacterium]